MVVLVFWPVRAAEMEKENKCFTDPVSIQSLSLINCQDLHSSGMFWSVTGCLLLSVSGRHSGLILKGQMSSDAFLPQWISSA